jgi:uncharacterized protein (DUF362 family)
MKLDKMDTSRNMKIGNGSKTNGMSRRGFLVSTLVGAVGGLLGVTLLKYKNQMRSEVFIAGVKSYSDDITSVILSGLKELGIGPAVIKGKRVLLKPNLVEVIKGASHINTHPLVIRGAIETFLRLGASEVIVGEGQGHVRDSYYVLEESGLADVLYEDRIPYIDLNNDSLFTLPNKGRFSNLKELSFPQSLKQADIIVSMAKMKTHHWAGVTLSMKNMFGVMPGIVYGWPKNVLHHAGIERSILDINATIKPHFAIVDGITGMEGDGPIMGAPCHAGVLVMGRNLTAVDATSARIMGVDPQKIAYLKAASNRLGPIKEKYISQRGELINAVRKNFRLREDIPAQRGLRMA